MTSAIREIVFSRTSANGDVNAVSGRAAACAFTSSADFLFANLALPVMAAKSAAAMVRGPNPCRINCTGLGYGHKVEEGYQVTIARLPKFATCQVVIMAKRPNLLLGERDEAIWRYLTSPSITTPLLPEWRDFIAESLVKKGRVLTANGFGYPVFEANFETKHVDEIVSKGLEKRKLKI